MFSPQQPLVTHGLIWWFNLLAMTVGFNSVVLTVIPSSIKRLQPLKCWVHPYEVRWFFLHWAKPISGLRWRLFPFASPPRCCLPHDSQQDSQLEEAFSSTPSTSGQKTPSSCWWASLPPLFPTANLCILLNGITAMKYDFLPVGNRNFATFC